MRGGALPPGLLAAALGLALAFAPRRLIAPAAVLFAAPAIAVAFLTLDAGWTEGVFLACWGCVILASLAALAPPRRFPGAVLVLAGLAGLCAGAVAAVAATPRDLLFSLPWVLICLPAKWLADRKGAIAVKVAASWLIAVCTLAAALPVTTPTPGYAADHME